MNIQTCVNTPDDVLFRNVFENSRKGFDWVKTIPEHDGQAILVGGGPSVADWVQEIRWRQSIGQTVFALNNAAMFLTMRDVIPDHQVILDARKSNIGFLGYAKHHYLASQCDPSLFDAANDVTLWHQYYPQNMAEFDAAIPEYGKDYSLVGGGTTVGLSAMALVYILGFRKIHLYGYDSSYRDGAGHAYLQTDPQTVVCDVEVGGKKFKSTLAMAQQAEQFPTLSDDLIDQGCIITIRGDGLLPWISQQSAIGIPMEEKEKYSAMWGRKEYRECAPGELAAQQFVDVAKVNKDQSVIDFGCGTGRGAKRIHELTGCNIRMVDFAENCLDKDNSLPFEVADLTKPIGLKADIGYCTDVMEHIPTKDVQAVIGNIMACVKTCFFQISLIHDEMGKLIGQHLHLTVKPVEWWRKLFVDAGYVVEQEQNNHSAAIFLISNTWES